MKKRFATFRAQGNSKCNPTAILLKNTASAITILNALLADEFVLATKARIYHWNVAELQDQGLCQLFGTQRHTLDEIMNDLARHARRLSGRTIGTLGEFLNLARLPEQPGKYFNPSQMIAQLVVGHETLIRQLRGDVRVCAERFGDPASANFLTGVTARHEKMAWLLHANLTRAQDNQLPIKCTVESLAWMPI